MMTRMCTVALLVAALLLSGSLEPAKAIAAAPPSAAKSAPIVLAAASGQAAPAAQPKRGGLLKAAIQQELAQLDPCISSGRDTTVAALHIWELLFAEDSRYIPVPMLAQSYTVSPDVKEYTITLRKGVPFHNGKEMKAEDVVASLNRWGAMSSLIGKPTFQNVAGVQGKGEYTVVITLKQPSGALLSALASPLSGAFIMPKEIVEQYKDKPLKEFVGTGPYVLKEYIPLQRATMARFDKYAARREPPSGLAGRRTAYLDTIQFVVVTEDAARMVGLEAGDYDLADFLPNDEYSRVSKNPKLQTIIWNPASGHARTILNTKMGLMSDVRMRQAVKLAVPPKPVMQPFGPEMFWRLTPSLMNEGQAYYSDAGKEIYLSYDPEKAKQLLKEAGYKGETLRFLTTKATDYYYTMSLVILDYMKKVGMNADLQVRDWATYLKMRDAEPQSWDLAGSGATFRSDPSQVPAIQSSGYAGFWSSKGRAELLEKMNSRADFTQRYKAWEELQSLYWKELPSIKWGDILQYRAASKNVKAEGDALEQVLLILWNTWKE